MVYIGFTEEWKILRKFKNIKNNIYEISNFGDVRIRKTKERVTFKIANRKKHPYYAVYLENNNGKKEWILVHQLVAHCFLTIPKKYKKEKDLVPDHLDNNGLNNFYLNLELKTRGENVKAAFERKEIDISCEKSPFAIINRNQAHMICKYLSENKSYNDILDLMNFPKTNQYRMLIIRIKNGYAWKEISKNYKFSEKISLTNKQKETIQKLPLIKKLIDEGYNNSEIFNIVWGSSEKKRESKMVLLRKIRKKEIYKEYL